MAITAEQARQELARRELERRRAQMEHQPAPEPITMGEALVEEAPQTVGGIAGGIAGAAKGAAIGAPFGPPGVAAGTLIGGVAGAAVGGAAGESYKQVYQHYVDPEDAPSGSMEAIDRILMAGGEEALYEAGGQVAGRVLGKAYHVLRPQRAAGIDALQNTFSKFGGKFTAAERTESFLMQQTDSIVRGSLTGKGIMKAADDVNEAALKMWQQDLANTIAPQASVKMTDAEFGKLVQNTLSEGKGAFKAAMREMYSGFDDLVKTKLEREIVAKKVPTDIMLPDGTPAYRTVQQEVINEVRPVDMRPLKEEAQQLLEKLGRIQKVGMTDFGGETISRIFALDDAARFADAQMLRSTLLDIGRGVANDPKEAKLAGSITKFADKVTKAMDEAALRQGKAEFKAYQKIKQTAEKGYKAFNDQLIAKMLRDDTSSSKIGEMIFREGNTDQILKFKTALTRAAQYDKSINARKVWEQTRQKYLEAMFNSITKEIPVEAGETLVEHQMKAGVVSADKLLRFFQDPKKVNTMAHMLSKTHQKALFDFTKAAALTQQKSVAGLSMLMQLAQGGVVIQAASGHIDALKKAAGILIPTRVLAHMMTTPSTVKLMTSATNTPRGTKHAGPIAVKLMGLYERSKEELEDMEG